MTPAELFLAYQKEVRGLARRLVSSSADVDELVSQTFELLPSVLKRRADRDARQLALGVCANLAKHLNRASARRAAAVDRLSAQPRCTSAGDPEQLLLEKEEADFARAALELLPEEQVKAFWLVGYEGHSAAEVAQLCGVPEATVRTRLFHARRKLRDTLEAWGLGLRVSRSLVLLLGALLVMAGGAWAASNSEVALGWLRRVVQRFVPPRRPAQAERLPVAAPPAPVVTASVEAPVALSEALSQPAAPQARERAPKPLRSDPHLKRFARANSLHFEERRYESAIEAWEAYLEHAPSGALALEARYNRAIALIRVNRRAEAVVALQPFAEGAFGLYRQAEAVRLIRALSSSNE